MQKVSGAAVKDLAVTAADRPTPEEIVRRATAMIPTLRARGAQADIERCVPAETVEDFKKAGFHRIGQPTRFGGMGYDQDVIRRMSMEVSRGCGASGWLACFFANHNMLIGMFPEEAQIEVWGSGRDVLCSTISNAGPITFEPAADGGMRINGRVRFSSGIDYANWVVIISMQGLYLIPKADVRIDDDWYVMGMKGSGSKAVVLEDVFVPSHRRVSVEALMACQNYGAQHYDAIHYGLPFAVWTASCQTSVILGMAKGLIELFDDRIRQRTDTHTMQPAIERPGWQLRFAEATAEVDAAHALFDTVFRDFEVWHAAGVPVSVEERARLRRNLSFVAKLCVSAADRLFDGGDASAVYDNNPIQRFFRDIRTVAVSISQVWDEPAIQYSRVRWGLPQQTMF